jgi:hypothetical protein
MTMLGLSQDLFMTLLLVWTQSAEGMTSTTGRLELHFLDPRNMHLFFLAPSLA